MALNLAKRLEALGGKVAYNRRVSKVITQNGRAAGVLLENGESLTADAVIVTVDTLAAIDHLFDEPLNEPWMNEMRQNTDLMLCSFICIGVKADLSALPGSLMFSLKEPTVLGGIRLDALSANHYAGYKGYAPDDCTAITMPILGDSYAFWQACQANGTYEAEKKRMAETAIRLLAEKWPRIVGSIDVVDVATPLTYERYCGTYHGSWMSGMKKGVMNASYPIANEGIKNLYFAGQRMMPPGGLPVAVFTGRQAVQYVCRDMDVIF
jgi:phytoene dehydrogenase-like protein